jgi:hypothetical protein
MLVGRGHTRIIQTFGMRVAVGSLFLGGLAFRTAVADGLKNFGDRAHGLCRRDPGRRITPDDIERAVASMRVGAILHPTVFLALADGAGSIEHRDGPAAQRPDCGPSFLEQQHRSHLPERILRVRPLSTGQGFGNAWSAVFPRVPWLAQNRGSFGTHTAGREDKVARDRSPGPVAIRRGSRLGLWIGCSGMGLLGTWPRKNSVGSGEFRISGKLKEGFGYVGRIGGQTGEPVPDGRCELRAVTGAGRADD